MRIPSLVKAIGFPIIKRINNYYTFEIRLPEDITMEMHTLIIHGICGSSKKLLAICLCVLACNNFMKVTFFFISQLLKCLMEADIYEAVKHAFPDVLTEEKQYKKLSNLLQK